MDTPGFASPIRSYQQNLGKMRESNDQDGSEVINLCLLGVVDLDLSVSPDVFGLRAFEANLPITRMLPVSSPCEQRLLLPDSMIGKECSRRGGGKPDCVIDVAVATHFTV